MTDDATADGPDDHPADGSADHRPGGPAASRRTSEDGRPPWRRIVLSDDPVNDALAYVVAHQHALSPRSPNRWLGLVTTEGEILQLDLLTRHPTASVHPSAASSVRPSPVTTAVGQAVVNTGIGTIAKPGASFRARVRDGEIVEIAPARIVEHPMETAIAAAFGVDVDGIRGWALDATIWPTFSLWTTRPDQRLHLVQNHDNARLTLNLPVNGRCAIVDGHVILPSGSIPETVALHIVGKPLCDVLAIDGLEHLPIVIHAVDSGTSTLIDFAPQSECVDVVAAPFPDQAQG